ncbi:MAG: isoprenylcysteine carboxylmethyltransferase family protein [Tabrizicola sp.]|nr:isoprenylcysteine carboxylmethyltransferase family protein [Tabrizicola sp.]
MNKTLEDSLGKLAMLLIFGYLCIQQVQSFVISFNHRDQIALWQLAVLSQLCGVLFVGMILYYTVTRLPPRDSVVGLMPRIVAVTGTFVMMLLVVLPPEPISPTLRIVSTLMIILGTCLSIYCLNQLGRSFSIMATSRELRTGGGYSIVRHPLYGAEVVMILGVVLAHGSPLAFGVGLMWLALQIRRAQYEESVLRRTFPEYEDYARRVPMLIPGLRVPLLEGAARNGSERV